MSRKLRSSEVSYRAHRTPCVFFRFTLMGRARRTGMGNAIPKLMDSHAERIREFEGSVGRDLNDVHS